MKRSAASDLSAYLMLEQYELSPAQELLSQIDCTLCQDIALRQLFYQALRLREELAVQSTWKMQRLNALLGPMYLEAIQEIERVQTVQSDGLFENDRSQLELLLAEPTWRIDLDHPCCTAHLRECFERGTLIQKALKSLRAILFEVLRE